MPNDPNNILFNFQPTGASIATAKQDKLPQKGILGVAASRAMAGADDKRALPLKDKFIAAGEQFNIPPALLAAIASRESRCGAVLKNGFGDQGNAFGIMQVDKRFHVLKGTDDAFGQSHIAQATGILRASIDRVQHNHPDWPLERQMQGGVSGYNQGANKIMTLDHMDIGSTGNDYSNDVWARAQFYAEKMGTVSPAIAVTSSTIASSSLTFPAPALSEVLAGHSTLARKQRGDAIVTLQNALLNLQYLTLTDEEKLSGLGIFGPKTEQAVIAFQQDVYLTPNGICDALTFLALAQILSAGVKRNNDNQIGIVRRLQDRLAALQNLAPAQIGNGYGNFGPLTEGGLKQFQQQQNQLQDGILTVASYLRLRALAPNAAPAITPSTDGNDTAVNVQLPPGGPGFIIKLGSPPGHQFATERTINRFMAIASAWNATGVGFPLRAGEMSIKGGGVFGSHTGEGHRDGFALDLGLFRKDRKNQPTNINDPTYDRALTQQLITALDQSPLVVLMICNDRQISAGNKLRHDKEGTHIHDNHVHVEFRKRSA